MSHFTERMDLIHQILKAFLALEKRDDLQREFDEADADYQAKLYWLEMIEITTKNLKIMLPVFIILFLVGSSGGLIFLLRNPSLMMVLWFVSYKKVKDKYYSQPFPKGNHNPSIIEEEWDRLIHARENLAHLLSEERYLNDISLIPKRYRSAKMTGYLFEIVSDNRAQTLKEALNILEEDLHRMRMEQKQQELIDAQKRAEEAANGASDEAIILALYYYSQF